MEADIAFLDDPDAHKADLVDGAIGELSSFHEMYAYYAQGVEVSTAILPDGWHDRVVPFVPTSAEPTSAEPATAVCLEPHDLVVSKLAAMREKDRIFGVGTGRRAPRGPHRQRLRRSPSRSRSRHRPFLGGAFIAPTDRHLDRRRWHVVVLVGDGADLLDDGVEDGPAELGARHRGIPRHAIGERLR